MAMTRSDKKFLLSMQFCTQKKNAYMLILPTFEYHTYLAFKYRTVEENVRIE